MFYSLLGRTVWYGLKLFLRIKYGSTYVPKKRLARRRHAAPLAGAVSARRAAQPLRRRRLTVAVWPAWKDGGPRWPSRPHPPCPATSSGCPDPAGAGSSASIRPSPEPPALILRTAGGAEVRVEARPGPATEYDIPS